MSLRKKRLPLLSDLSATPPADCASTGCRVLFHGVEVLGTAFEVTQRYTDLVPIGMGASGIVCSARDLATKDTVAVKKLNDPFRTNFITKLFLREIQLLQRLRHENVINLTDMFISPSEDIYIVTEHVHTDLANLLQRGPLEGEYSQFFFYQMIRGLKYIHSAGVIHRDLKPSNVLIEKNCDLKICDFGLARVQEPRMTGYVSTRYYRAPEVMLSWQRYDEKVDVWSAGCILAEMLLGRVLFPGRNHIHQFTLIAKLLGKPSGDLLKAINKVKVKPMAEVIPGADPNASDILERLLVFDAQKRPSARDILESPYLAQYHDPNDEPTADKKLDWSFPKANLSPEGWKRAVYAEILGYCGRSERSHAAEQLRQCKPMNVEW